MTSEGVSGCRRGENRGLVRNELVRAAAAVTARPSEQFRGDIAAFAGVGLESLVTDNRETGAKGNVSTPKVSCGGG